MGATISNPNDRDVVVKAYNNCYASGFTYATYAQTDAYQLSISNFDINFTAKDSINFAGVAMMAGWADITNVDVNANFTSYNYSKAEKNFSTTYYVAGAVANASSGLTLDSVKVIINANKGVDTTKKYGAAFFGGLVARYLGDNDGEGMTITNCVVGGEVYFNYSYETATFIIDEEQNITETMNVFVAGGLVGSMSVGTAGESVSNVDAFAPIAVASTVIANNTVSGLKITADFTNETLASQAYRVRGIGALVGTVNVTNGDELDLSTNTIANIVEGETVTAYGVEIVADTESFTYAYAVTGGTTSKVLLGANKDTAYGASYTWNTGDASSIASPADLSAVHYTELSA